MVNSIHVPLEARFQQSIEQAKKKDRSLDEEFYIETDIDLGVGWLGKEYLLHAINSEQMSLIQKIHNIALDNFEFSDLKKMWLEHADFPRCMKKEIGEILLECWDRVCQKYPLSTQGYKLKLGTLIQ